MLAGAPSTERGAAGCALVGTVSAEGMAAARRSASSRSNGPICRT
ncbi:hypothetical protein OG767_21695 [Micromonospora sp. NBC_01392]